VLDPRRVTPMISSDGSIFYKLSTDELNVTGEEVMVPASEIIHDRFNCDHWLIGVPPIYASGLAAMQGLNIQNQSANLYRNNAQPSGILTAPGEIDEDTVTRLG
jgi:phage portal protein BeeE